MVNQSMDSDSDTTFTAPPPHISKDLLKDYSLVWLKLYQVLQITPPVSSHPSHPYPPTTYLQELRFSFDKANLSWHILAPNCFPRPKTTTIWQQVVWSFSFDIFFGLFEMKLFYNYKLCVVKSKPLNWFFHHLWQIQF